MPDNPLNDDNMETAPQSAFAPYYKPLPRIKGYCKGCLYSFYPKHDNIKNDLMCKFWEASEGGAFVEPEDYCNHWKKND